MRKETYDIKEKKSEGTQNYKELLSYIESVGKINKSEYLEISKKYGLEILIETKKMVGVHTGSIEVWDTYESIIALVKDKVSFNITNDKEIMLDAVKNNVITYNLVSRKLKNDKGFILRLLKVSDNKLWDKMWIITQSSKGIREICANKNPIIALESAIAYNELKSTLDKKNKIKKVKKNKI